MRSPQNSFVNTGKGGKDESCGKGGKISYQLSVIGCRLSVGGYLVEDDEVLQTIALFYWLFYNNVN